MNVTDISTGNYEYPNGPRISHPCIESVPATLLRIANNIVAANGMGKITRCYVRDGMINVAWTSSSGAFQERRFEVMAWETRRDPSNRTWHGEARQESTHVPLPDMDLVGGGWSHITLYALRTVGSGWVLHNAADDTWSIIPDWAHSWGKRQPYKGHTSPSAMNPNRLLCLATRDILCATWGVPRAEALD